MRIRHPAPPQAARAAAMARRPGRQTPHALARTTALQAKLHVGDPADVLEQEADREADRVMAPAPSAGAFASSSDAPVRRAREPTADASTEHAIAGLSGRGQALPPSLRSFMETRFEADFSAVRVHDDAQAHGLARSLGARAFTVGRDVVFGAGQYATDTDSGRRLLAHELTHVVQQAAGVKQVQCANDERAAIPAAERREIQVDTSIYLLNEEMPDMFTLVKKDTPGTHIDVDGNVQFGSTVPQAPPVLRMGLKSVAGWLTQAGDSGARLPLNATTTLALDLTPYGGSHTLYRFTYYTHGQGRRGVKTLLIEQLDSPAALPAATSAQAGTFTVRNQSFKLGSGWTDERWPSLRQALALMPDGALAEAAGLTFVQRGAGSASEAGHYDVATDTVEIHDNAFVESPRRFGAAAGPTRAMLHEIGHALDLRRLERAWKAFDKAGQTADAQRILEAARSLSGSRYQAPKGGGDYVNEVAMGSFAGNDFRLAAQKDGVTLARDGRLTHGITAYGNTDWQEAFAEAFSLYVTEPGTLQLLRPKLYAYFVAHFPR